MAEDIQLENLSTEKTLSAVNQDVDVHGQPMSLHDHDSPPHVDDEGHQDPEHAAVEPIDKFNQPGRVRRLATIMNLLNTLLGAGILGVPNSMISCGWVIGALLITLVAVLTYVCTDMTIKMQRRLEADGLDDMATKVLGRAGSIFLSIMSMVYCYSCMVSYLIINYGTIASWFELGDIDVGKMWQRALIVFISGMIGPVALTLPRRIGWMKPFSYISFGVILFYGLSMIIKAIIKLPYPDHLKPVTHAVQGGMGLFSAISVYSLAFALPVVVLPIIEPYNPELKRRSLVTGVAIFLCWLTVIVPGIIGYFMFGEDCKTIIIESFAADDWLIFVVRLGFVSVVTSAYPAIGQSVMASWSNLLYKTNCQYDLPRNKRAVVLLITNIIPMALAMFLPDAKPALNIGGAFGGCLADFFFPGLLWFLISKKRWFHWQNILCIILIVFGAVVAVISTYQSVIDAIDAFS